MTIREIRIGMGSCGLAAGAAAVRDALAAHTDAPVRAVGCIGHCYAEPLVEVVTEAGSAFFANVNAKEDDIERVLSVAPERQLRFREERCRKEQAVLTAHIGAFEPIDMDAYAAVGGFTGLDAALSMAPEEVIAQVEASGLRGRGGGGFPTGRKWRFLAEKTGPKVLVCNADEGDPGAFMDRSLMESLPYQVLEGMLIGAWATGADSLYIYCRAEYPLAIAHLRAAIDRLVAAGRNKLNGRAVTIAVKEGAGAFVCGEETALIHSLEGRRGMPRFRPPFPTDSGFRGLPTAINNVETFANIPVILASGAERFASVGTPGSTGTKLFALAGDIPFPGLVEVPLGVTIADIVYAIGGAEPGSIKSVQIGGPSGGCIPASLFDTPVDYDSLRSLGAIMGSGGLIAIGTHRCMVETARYFLDFTHRESCGKCTFCRVGTKRMFEALERIVAGRGTDGDMEFLSTMGDRVRAGSLCGLGKTAPNPVLAALRYFKEEFAAHVTDRQCPAKECAALYDLTIDPQACTECGLCRKNCPVDAIDASYVIDNTACTRCTACIAVCRYDAVHKVDRGAGHRAEHGERA